MLGCHWPAIVAVTTTFREAVVSAKVVEHIFPAARARFRIFDQPLELEPVSHVAVFILTHQPREVIVSQVGLEQMKMP